MSTFNKAVGKPIGKIKEEKLKGNWKKTKIVSESNFVGSDIINRLLSKPGAVGLRIYYGMDDEGNMQPVIYASDETGNPIITATLSSQATEDDSGGVNATLVCPPYCPTK